ncbi:MAG: helix-turn-helix transcriptional regulator [Patescibacteria group bacterium]
MKKTPYNRIPNCLRKYRKARGLKQSNVAKILRIKSTSLISRWEKGVCLPNTLNSFKLSILYRTLIVALFIDLYRTLKEEILKREKEVFRMRHA